MPGGEVANAGVEQRVAAALCGAGPVLGVDVGGSSTRAALIVDGEVRQRLLGGPFNFLLQDDGVTQLADLARQARPAAMGVGVPGIAREPGAAGRMAAAITEACGVPAQVASDATVAWLGAFLGDPGIIVLAGTGSVAIGGRTPDGIAIIGGHGHLVGDEGSAYWIGRRALRAALAARDGTGPATVLGEALSAAAGATLDEIVHRAQRAPGDRSVLTALAPIAGRCAGEPDLDQVAGTILADAAAALAALAGALRRRFGDLPVAGAGGVFAMCPVWAAFQQATGATGPLAPPEVGAALLLAREPPQ